MKSKEQSAIDSIYTILEKIELLDRRVQIIDDNIKILSNKVSKVGKNVAAAAVSSSPIVKDNIHDPPARQQKVEKLILGNIKTHGYIVNKAKNPLENVIVNIYDGSNQLIKNTKTNNDGHWEVRLPPGKYGVEYIHKKFKPINRVVNLADGIREFEVR